MPDVIWAPLQRRLIEAMAGERMTPRALCVPGVTVPRRLCSVRLQPDHASRSVRLQPDHVSRSVRLQPDPYQRVERIEPDPEINPLAHLMSPRARGADLDLRLGRNDSPDPIPESSSGPIALFHAGGRDAEIDEVFRRILASGAPLDLVEIACASDEHVALVWEKALRHEWPVTLGPGIAATATRPGRALIGFCDWIETDLSAGHLRHLLQSGDMGIEKDDEGFTAGEAARTLARAEAGRAARRTTSPSGSFRDPTRPALPIWICRTTTAPRMRREPR